MNKYAILMERLSDFGGHMPPQTPNHVPQEELDAVERELGHTLPPDYHEFLRDYGGFHVGATVDFSGRGFERLSYGACEFFYGVEPDNYWVHLVTRYRARGFNEPPELLPISQSDNGYMYLILFGPEQGAIYFLHRTQGATWEFAQDLYFVAHTFDKFMHLLEG